MMEQPRLSQYTKFYILLQELVGDGSVTVEQRKIIRDKLMQRESSMMSLVANYIKGQQYEFQYSEAQFREKIIEASKAAIRPPAPHLKKMPRFSVSARQIIVKEEQQSLESSTGQQISQLIDILRQHQERKTLYSSQDQERMRTLRNILNEALGNKIYYKDENMNPVENHSPTRSRLVSMARRQVKEVSSDSQSETSVLFSKLTFDQKIIERIEQIYKELKMVFQGNMQSHLLLMQDEISYSNLFKVVKEMVKTLVDADGVVFITKSTQYSSIDDSMQEVDSQNLFDHLKPCQIYTCMHNSIESKSLHKILGNSQKYEQISIVRFMLQETQVVFAFIWKDSSAKLQRKFIQCANEYGYKEEVIALCQFLVELIMQARVKYFNPLQFADSVQDLALSFVGISRYILVDQIQNSLETHYKVQREQTFSEDGLAQAQETEDVRIELKCVNPVTLIVKGMNLSIEAEKKIYTHIIQIKDQYESYLRLCHEKTAYYKYFIRSSDSLIFDFNKKGQLIFLSHPIWPILKEKYGVQYQTEWRLPSYTDIFKDKTLLDLIVMDKFKEKKRNEYLQHDEFEIFIKVVDEKFKGFIITFHQQDSQRIKEYIKGLKTDNSLEVEIQQTIRRQVNKHQTFKFLNKLEQNNPGVMNSMISLFIPEDNKSTGTIKEPSSSRNKRVSISFIPKDIISKEFHESMTIKSIEEIDDVVDEINVNSFNFNILIYDSPSIRFKVVKQIIDENQWMEMYKIDENTLDNLLKETERKYNKRKNPFHNFDHGVSVMQCVHYLASLPSASILSDIVHFTTVLSGLFHDIGHTGRANQFEINSRSKLALRYHDRSPLENHHAAYTMKLLSQDQYNILKQLTDADRQIFKSYLIENILYTDIKQHFALLKDFENRMKEKDFGSDPDIKLFTGMILHTADFNGGAKVFEVSRQWSVRVNQEFEAQYKQEGELNLPQTPFLKDLDKIAVMAKSEMGFFKVIVRPLWALLNEFYEGEIQQALENLDNTIISWEKVYNQPSQ